VAELRPDLWVISLASGWGSNVLSWHRAQPIGNTNTRLPTTFVQIAVRDLVCDFSATIPALPAFFLSGGRYPRGRFESSLCSILISSFNLAELFAGQLFRRMNG